MSSEELNKMSKKTHSQDSNSDPRNEEDYDTCEKKSLEAYIEAAKSDAFLFGDYDAYEAYKE